MKKIIAAFDGLKYSSANSEFSARLAQLSKSHLVGVFLEDLAYTSYNVYQLLIKKNVPEKKLRHYQQLDQNTRDKAIEAFSKECNNLKIEYSIHKNHQPALRELLHETVFSDLLIIDKHETFTHYKEEAPTRFIRDLLAESQCPVLLTSASPTLPDGIIILYDGHPSSVYALKMFSYLFSSLKHLPAQILSCKPIPSDLHLPENKLMKEFVKRHLPKATFKVLNIKSAEDIVRHLIEKEGNPLIVLGAYSRGMLSRWYRPSIADMLMQNLKFPLFVAHQK